jgi:hypothetical protein
VIGVVGHVDRHTMATALADTVKADYLHLDDGTLGCNGNHLHVWDWLTTHNTDEWSIVLEDDAIPVDDFRYQLDTALHTAPTPIVSLYLGTGRPPHWQARVDLTTNNANAVDANWIISNELIHAVGIAIRTDLLPLDLPDKPIDDAISAWAQTHGHKVGYTWPSLVDHHDGPTLIDSPDRAYRTARRVARWHAGRTTWMPRAVTM